LLPDTGVVLVAAGRGLRAGGGVPKQFRAVAGVPLVSRALNAFLAHPAVAHVSLVLPPENVAAPPAWLLLSDPRVALVAGGTERSESVRLGLAALPAGCSVVLVHDAARPFVPRDLIDRVVAVARAGEGAVPALPVTDTIKRAGGDPPRVDETVSRDGLWRAQTPQGFPRAALEAAHRSQRAADQPSTDDAALVERSGLVVRLVPGSAFNLKVTTSDDFAVAELLARGAPP
jgi:2-C-methyl-D-erythritol 4-phosphate cytidylyltransferase